MTYDPKKTYEYGDDELDEPYDAYLREAMADKTLEIELAFQLAVDTLGRKSEISEELWKYVLESSEME